MIIRAATDDDGVAIGGLIERIYREYEGVHFLWDEVPELEQVATTFAEAGGAFFCAERDGRIVGCIGWTPTKEGRGVELKKLYVAREERRHGLGQRLTELVEQAARARGASFVELWSDVKFLTAHAFYERRGYRRDGRSRPLNDVSDTWEFHFLLPLAAEH